MAGDGGLLGWAERSTRRRACIVAEGPVPGRLRFVFYGRVSQGSGVFRTYPLLCGMR